jgi:YVTN family beta-propeller protein
MYRNAKIAAAVFSLAFLAPSLFADTPARAPADDVNRQDVRQRQGMTPDENLLFNGWGMTPAGQHVPISGDLALKMIVSPDHKRLVAVTGGYSNQGLTLLDIESRKVTQYLPMPEAWNGLAFSNDGKKIFVAGGDKGTIHVFNYADGQATQVQVANIVNPSQTAAFIAGIAVHPSNGMIYVCNEANHELLVLDGETLVVKAAVAVGQHPHTVMVGADPRYVYVSNWGSKSVSVVDTTSNHRVRDMTMGLRPNDMALAKDGRLFVACAGDNTVHVIQTITLEKAPEDPSPARRLWEGTREVISTSLYPQSPEGSTPDALAVSPDGKTLFIANADNNDVMVVDISGKILDDKVRKFGESVSVVNGFIPTGWYPSALAVSPDNKTLFVADGKGLRSQSNLLENARPRPNQRVPYRHIGKTLEGAVSFIEKPDAEQMAKYTQQVRRNSPYTPEDFHKAPIASDSIIPDKVGAPCPIKYVVYVIKENRTYDQVMGDLKDSAGKKLGNGDPRLVMYGENVTPNHHQLARDYVLMDNLYCNGEVSADGHSWCDAAIATDFKTRSWIMSYSKHGKLPGNEEMENPASGYLWDLCREHGVTYRNYGEGAQRVPSTNRGRWQGARDMDKVKCWIDDLQEAEKSGTELPRFTIMSLGEDHTKGATPGVQTPGACVGSNDVAIGRLVEAASHSKFWNEMALFIIEDDAQNGPDHVDAHRTVGLVISPWCKQHTVDSTLYTTASFVRTMELILGLPPLTQYDAGATPMFNCFTKEAHPVAYTPLAPKVDLYAKNTPATPFAKESAMMDFHDYDLAPEDQLNRILWHLAKGMDEPYPAPIHRALFTAPTAAEKN